MRQNNREPVLTGAGLISDSALRDGDGDAFRHQPIAARAVELAVSAAAPVNIALFGPWGSGKSSFYTLEARLRRRLESAGHHRVYVELSERLERLHQAGVLEKTEDAEGLSGLLPDPHVGALFDRTDEYIAENC